MLLTVFRLLRHLKQEIITQSVSAINACSDQPCHADAHCDLTGPGTHICVCKHGFTGDGTVCLPINPCDFDRGGCTDRFSKCAYLGPGQVSITFMKIYVWTTSLNILTDIFKPIKPYFIVLFYIACYMYILFWSCILQSSCHCLEGYKNNTETGLCTLIDLCPQLGGQCHKFANCSTVQHGQIEWVFLFCCTENIHTLKTRISMIVWFNQDLFLHILLQW